jgi:hypothetical protein
MGVNKMAFSVLAAVVLVCSGTCVAANLVVNGGFETSEPTQGNWPSVYGDWLGDYSGVVGATGGIAPYGGARMLQFRGGAWPSRASRAGVCEVPQIVDVSAYAGLIDSGEAVARASVRFNRVAGDSQTDTMFGLKIYAHAGSASSYPTSRANGAWLTYGLVSVYTDGDAESWEECTAELPLPVDTDYIVIEVHAAENVYNDTSGTEFDGHFADAVWLEIDGGPVTIPALEIVGPNQVVEHSYARYRAIAIP